MLNSLNQIYVATNTLLGHNSQCIFQPYKPFVRDEMGLDNFDTQFTDEPARLTPDPSDLLSIWVSN